MSNQPQRPPQGYPPQQPYYAPPPPQPGGMYAPQPMYQPQNQPQYMSATDSLINSIGLFGKKLMGDKPQPQQQPMMYGPPPRQQGYPPYQGGPMPPQQQQRGPPYMQQPMPPMQPGMNQMQQPMPPQGQWQQQPPQPMRGQPYQQGPPMQPYQNMNQPPPPMGYPTNTNGPYPPPPGAPVQQFQPQGPPPLNQQPLSTMQGPPPPQGMQGPPQMMQGPPPQMTQNLPPPQMQGPPQMQPLQQQPMQMQQPIPPQPMPTSTFPATAPMPMPVAPTTQPSPPLPQETAPVLKHQVSVSSDANVYPQYTLSPASPANISADQPLVPPCSVMSPAAAAILASATIITQQMQAETAIAATNSTIEVSTAPPAVYGSPAAPVLETEPVNAPVQVEGVASVVPTPSVQGSVGARSAPYVSSDHFSSATTELPPVSSSSLADPATISMQAAIDVTGAAVVGAALVASAAATVVSAAATSTGETNVQPQAVPSSSEGLMSPGGPSVPAPSPYPNHPSGLMITYTSTGEQPSLQQPQPPLQQQQQQQQQPYPVPTQTMPQQEQQPLQSPPPAMVNVQMQQPQQQQQQPPPLTQQQSMPLQVSGTIGGLQVSYTSGYAPPPGEGQQQQQQQPPQLQHQQSMGMQSPAPYQPQVQPQQQQQFVPPQQQQPFPPQQQQYPPQQQPFQPQQTNQAYPMQPTPMTASVAVSPVSPTGAIVPMLSPELERIRCLMSAEFVKQPETAQCSIATCGKKFTAFARRHACRCCGACICNECSDVQSCFPARSTGLVPQRVCKVCFPLMQQLLPTSPNAPAGSSSMTAKDQDELKNRLATAAVTTTGYLGKFVPGGKLGSSIVKDQVGKAAVKVYCTADEKREQHMQDVIFCLSCDPHRQRSMCLHCSLTCHGTHKLHPGKTYSMAVCQCAFNGVSACRMKGGVEKAAYDELVKTFRQERLDAEAAEREMELHRAKLEALKVSASSPPPMMQSPPPMQQQQYPPQSMQQQQQPQLMQQPMMSQQQQYIPQQQAPMMANQQQQAPMMPMQMQMNVQMQYQNPQ